MQIIGKLTTKLPRETGTSKSGKSWEKQSIVIEQAGTEYNKEVVVTFFGDKIKSLRDIEEGSEVNVSINLSSREYNGKYYHNIDGYQFTNQSNNPEVNEDFVTSDDDLF